jgi:hypothetical protein
MTVMRIRNTATPYLKEGVGGWLRTQLAFSSGSPFKVCHLPGWGAIRLQ